MNKLLRDKVIAVSGGTKGVGRALCIECAKQGAKVAIGGRDENSAKEIINTIRSFGGEAIFVYTDLKNISDCEKLFDTTVNTFGKLDGFVNYAGLTYASALTDTGEELFDDVVDVNFKAAFFCAKHAVRYMMKFGGGSIIMIGSPHAWRGEEDRAAYACSKGALVTLTEHIAYHYAKYKIRCNLVTLGWTATEGEIALREKQGITCERLHEMAESVLPMGRMMVNEDYIPGIVYLLSDFSSTVTGSNLRMSGGEYI